MKKNFCVWVSVFFVSDIISKIVLGFFGPLHLALLPNQHVAIGNPERHVHKASHCGSKQQ